MFINMDMFVWYYTWVVLVQEQRQTVVENACPGPGACGGMYTANTMASAIEVRKTPCCVLHL